MQLSYTKSERACRRIERCLSILGDELMRRAKQNLAIALMNSTKRLPRILLVEDDDQIRLLLENFLRNAGYEVNAAATVSEGCSLLTSKTCDLLLTDGNLPDGTGLTIAQKANEKGIKVLLLTGHPHEFRHDQRDYITILEKPMRLSDLLQEIQDSFRRGA